MGRVASVGRAVAYTTIPLGALAGGWVLGRSHAMATLFTCAAGIQFLVLVSTAVSPLARIDSETHGGVSPLRPY
jgi:predicted MFS family arabinose efflux permease